MADSLRASATGLDLIDQARRHRRWNKTASTWYQQAFTSRSTLNRFWAGQLIRSEAFIALCDVVGVPWQQVADLDPLAREQLTDSLHPSRTPLSPQTQRPSRLHWGDAPDTQIFYGREGELSLLRHWITQDPCRLVLIQGMGGMGKTMLAARLVRDLLEQLTPKPDWIVWQSLRNGPSLAQLLNAILTQLNPTQTHQPSTVLDAQLQLLDLLREQRGILILDNLETILLNTPSETAGANSSFNAGYEAYEDLFRLIGESAHQSRVIVTSREIPRSMANQFGPMLPMRCYALMGLNHDAMHALFQDKGHFTGIDQDWEQILSHYSGNPLALKIIATSVRDFFDGNLTEFLGYLQDDPVLFDDIRDLLDSHFSRLSEAERTIMYWLAINREATSLPTLKQDIQHLQPGEMLKAIAALQHRSLVEKEGKGFTLQPVVMEYILAQLIDAASAAFLAVDATSPILRHYAFAKAQSKDYLYNIQVKLIVQPIYDRIIQQLSPDECRHHAQQLLKQWQTQPSLSDYGPGNVINLFRCGHLSVRGLDCSTLPIWQANLQGLDLRDVSFAQADLSRSVLTDMIGNILSAAFSADGTILGTSDNGYRIRLWNVKTGQLLNICQGHTHWIRSVCFSPCPSSDQPMAPRLASGSADGTVRVWDVTTGTERFLLSGHRDEVFCVTFCSDGRRLLSASGDRTLRLWDSETAECCQIFEGHQDRVRTLACTPTEVIASGDERGTICLWEFNGNQKYCINAHKGWVRTVQFNATGTRLMSGGNDGIIRIWDVQTGQLQREWSAHLGGVYTLSLSADDRYLATGGADHQIRLWNPSDGSAIATLTGHHNQIYSVCFSPDGQTLAGVSLDQTLKLWDWRQNQCLRTWRGYTDWGFPVDISADDQCLVSGSGAHTLHLWDLQQHRRLKSLSGFPALIRSALFLPHQQLAVAGADAVIQIWNWSSQYCIRQLRGHQDWVLSLAILDQPSRSILASASADRSIRLWNPETGKEEAVLLGHQDHVNAIAFHAQHDCSHLLASASSDHQVKLWNWQTGTCLRTFTGHQHRVYGVCFHPTQPWLISAGADRTIRIWHIDSGECLQVLREHQGWIFAIAVSPCGDYLLSAGQDQQVKLWAIPSGECIRSFRGHRHQIYSLKFSAEGSWFASGSQDQTIRIWDLHTGQCRQQLSARLYEGMNITGTRGLSSAQRLTLEELGAMSL